MKIAVLCVTMLLALTACATEADSPPQSLVKTERIPPPAVSTSPRSAMMQALLIGTLRGDPDRRCMWVGKAGSGVSILWPSHVAVRRAPLRLIDTRSHETIARAGERVRIGGGSSPLPPHEEPACRVSTHIFIAHQVDRGLTASAR